MIWVIDACINIAQGPYLALIPDVVPQEQHSLANSYISLAIGLGSVVAAATAPVLKIVFHVSNVIFCTIYNGSFGVYSCDDVDLFDNS